MAHDVFISYSSKDKDAGIAVCEALEGNGVRCWMAPRDIVPGEGWARSILGAISRSRVMVLLLTTEANVSPQVEREVERAVHKRVPIVPVRIEDVMPGEALEYFLSAPHWFDASSPPLEQHMDRLTQAVRTVLNSRLAEKKPVGEEEPPGVLEAESEAVAGQDQPIPTEPEIEAVVEDEAKVRRPEMSETVAEIATEPLAELKQEEASPQDVPERETEIPVETAHVEASAALVDVGRARKVILTAVLSSVVAVVVVIATAASLGLVGALVWPA